MSNKTELIQLRVSPEDKAVIKANAQAEGISMSKYIIREAVKATGVRVHVGDTHVGDLLEQPTSWSGRSDGQIALDA